MVKAAADLAIKCEKDLNSSELTEEITHFKHHAISLLSNIKNNTPLRLLEFIHEYSLADIFPDICISLQLYLTLPCTTATCE